MEIGSVISFLLENPILHIVLLLGLTIYVWFIERTNKDFRKTVHEFMTEVKIDHERESVEIKHLDQCLDSLKKQIQAELLEHVRESKK